MILSIAIWLKVPEKLPQIFLRDLLPTDWHEFAHGKRVKSISADNVSMRFLASPESMIALISLDRLHRATLSYLYHSDRNEIIYLFQCACERRTRVNPFSGDRILRHRPRYPRVAASEETRSSILQGFASDRRSSLTCGHILKAVSLP